MAKNVEKNKNLKIENSEFITDLIRHLSVINLDGHEKKIIHEQILKLFQYKYFDKSNQDEYDSLRFSLLEFETIHNINDKKLSSILTKDLFAQNLDFYTIKQYLQLIYDSNLTNYEKVEFFNKVKEWSAFNINQTLDFNDRILEVIAELKIVHNKTYLLASKTFIDGFDFIVQNDLNDSYKLNYLLSSLGKFINNSGNHNHIFTKVVSMIDNISSTRDNFHVRLISALLDKITTLDIDQEEATKFIIFLNKERFNNSMDLLIDSLDIFSKTLSHTRVENSLRSYYIAKNHPSTRAKVKLLTFIFTSKLSYKKKLNYFKSLKEGSNITLLEILVSTLSNTPRYLPQIENAFLKEKLFYEGSILGTENLYTITEHADNYFELSYTVTAPMLRALSNNKFIRQKAKIISHIMTPTYFSENSEAIIYKAIDQIKSSDKLKVSLFEKITDFYLSFDRNDQIEIFEEMEDFYPRATLISKICKLKTLESLQKDIIKKVLRIESRNEEAFGVMANELSKCDESIKNDQEVLNLYNEHKMKITKNISRMILGWGLL